MDEKQLLQLAPGVCVERGNCRLDVELEVCTMPRLPIIHEFGYLSVDRRGASLFLLLACGATHAAR